MPLVSDKPDKLTHSITVALTKDQWTRIAEIGSHLAQTPTEVARSILLREVWPEPISVTILAELWALRYIVLNGLPVVPGIDAIRLEADQKKTEKALTIAEVRR